MITKLFQEGPWTIFHPARGIYEKGVYVEHLGCLGGASAKKRRGDEATSSYTFLGNRACHECGASFPDFIRNMLIFVKWTCR